jgi:hypothetical protein
MRRKWLVVALLTLSLAVLGVSACASKSLAGKWQNANKTEQTLEFLKDGGVIFNNGGVIITGKYELVGDDVVKVDFEGLAGGVLNLFTANTWQYQVSGNLMTITILGETATYKRVK